MHYADYKVVEVMNRIRALRAQNGIKQADLAKALRVSQAALSGYETGKFQADISTYIEMANFFGVSLDYLLGKPEPSQSGAVPVPVLGDVAAGLPLLAEENILDYEDVSPEVAASGEIFGLRVKGSSMEPRIAPGDVVIVRKQEDVDTGDTAVVLINGDSATVKKVKKETNGITLISNNPAYDPMYFSNDDIQRLPVTIIGKVIELRGKF